jgi:hypothetical protein
MHCYNIIQSPHVWLFLFLYGLAIFSLLVKQNLGDLVILVKNVSDRCAK